MNFNRQTILSFALVAMVLSGGLAGVATAAMGNSAINYEEGPDVYVHEKRVDIATHDRAEMDSVLNYYGDNGGMKHLPATQNDSLDETVAVRYDKINDSDLRKFPRDGSNSIVDASSWTKDVSGSAGSASITDTTTAPGVEAVQLSTSSQSSGDVAKFTASSNISITTDPEKRVLFATFNVDTLDSGAETTVRAVDSDGDYKAAEINASESTDTRNVAATATGNGYVFQQKLVDLPTEGSGDGTFDGIQKVVVVTNDADSSITITGIDLERKSIDDLGETMRDTNGDGEDEATTITEVETGGEVKLTGLDTLPSMFDDAIITDLGVFGVEYRSSDAEADDVSMNFSDAANYPGYPSKLDAYERVKVPTAIDLSHNNLELRAEQKFIGERYKTARVAEGTGDTDFTNISSWTDVSDSYTSKGDTHTLDSSIQPGQEYVWNGVLVLQSDEVKDLKDTGASGPGAPVDNGGGIFGNIWTWITGGIAVLTGGYVKLKGE